MEKSLTATTQECWEQYYTSTGVSTPESSSCTATYHPSWKLSTLDEPDMRDTAGEVGTNSHGQGQKAGRPARNYIQQFCADTGCSLEDLLGAMDDRGWRERVKEIGTGSATWWWWWDPHLFGQSRFFIIIKMLCRQHGYYWPSLATPPYRSSLLAGPQGYIPYPHRAVVCRFELVDLLLFGHMTGSIGEHLWARPCFSSNFLHVCFV